MFNQIKSAALGAALVAAAVPAMAQDYPSGNIVLVVPYSPGGGTDLASRILAERLGAQNGWTVVVENRPGAGGTIGLGQIARAGTNGLTLAMGQTANLAINPTLLEDVSYDPINDFTPIAVVNSQPTVIAVKADSPIQTLAELIEVTKANPGNISMATPGAGTVAHLSLELLALEADIEFLHIPYPGASQAVTDAIGGHVDFTASSLPSALSHIRSGNLKALAVTSADRSPALPDVPTVAESGYDGFAAGDWKALVGPANLPDAVVGRLNDAVNVALQDESLQATFAADGSTVVGGAPEDLRDLIAAEYARWSQIIQDAGLSAE